MATNAPFDLSRFRRIFSPFEQSGNRSHGGWETENPPLPPYPLNSNPLAPPPMLQGPPEPPPEPMPGPPQRTPQTPLNPPRISPMTSSPRTIPQPPFPTPQGQSPLDFPPGGPTDPSQFDIGADIRKSMPPRPPMPTGDTLPSKPQAPPAQAPPAFSTDYPKVYGEEEPVTPGLSRGGTGLRTPSELRPGTITNENMGQYLPDTAHPPLSMSSYKDEVPADISGQAQANAPENFFANMPQSEEEQINQAISQYDGYKPQTTMQDRLNTLLSSFPQRDQDMSKWRKFGSFVTGVGLGPEAQERATYAPFYRQLGDWQAQMDPTLKGAELEKQENINLRQLVHNTAMERVAGQNANTREAGENRRYEQGNRALEIKERIASINEMKRKDANWKFDVDMSTGTVWGYHPTQGKYDTGIKANEVSEEQKHLWRMSEIQERGRIAGENKPDKIHYYDDWSTGVPVHKKLNEETGEIANVEDPFTKSSAKPSTAPPAQGAPAPTQQPTGQFPSLKGVNTGFGAQQPQAPPQVAKPTTPPAQGRPQSDTDAQKGLQTQVARAKLAFPDYADFIEWNDETKLPEIEKPTHDWLGFGSGWTPYDWETYDEINKFIDPKFKRFNELEQQITGTEDNRSSGSNTRTTKRGTTVTRID